MMTAIHTPIFTAVIESISKYYQQHEDASVDLAAWMAQTFSPACVLSLVDEILSCSPLLTVIAARSYHHGNGFLKVVLAAENGWKLRLHVWFPNTPCEENIHDHRWGFASTVLCGQLVSETFVDDANGNISATEYVYFARQATCMSHKFTKGQCRLRSLGQQRRLAGESYYLPTSVLHRICDDNIGNDNQCGLVATMMCSAPSQLGTNRLLVSADRDGIDPNVEQIPLTTHELAYLLQRFSNLYTETLWLRAA